MRIVAAIPSAGLLAGAAIGFLFSEKILPLAYPSLAAGAAASVWACWRVRPRLMAAAIVVAFAAGGAVLAAEAWRAAWRPTLRIGFEGLARLERVRAAAEGRVLPDDDEAFAIVEGVLRSDAAPTGSGISLSVAVDAISRPGPLDPATRAASTPRVLDPASIAVRGGLLVTVVGSLGPSRLDNWRAGRRVRMPVQLHRPARYLNPGVPDNERALARRGTTLVGTVKSGALVEVTSKGRWWSESAAAVRQFARHAIVSSVGRWSAQSAAIVAAIAIGDRAGLDDEVERRLQEAGTYHVIAISGGNIAILAGLLLAAFRLAGCLGRGAMLAAIVVLMTYASLVGGGASVDRATLMAVVYFGARAIDQRSPPLNALWLVAAVLVVTDPLTVVDPAFVLTFGATLGILVVVPTVQVRQQRSTQNSQSSQRSSFLASSPGSALYVVASGVLAASVAAEALLFPVGALLFSRVTFAGLALNFLAIPLMAIAQVAGMAVVPVTLVSERLAASAGWVAHLGAAGLVWSADLVQFVPVATWRVAGPPWWVVLAYYTALVVSWTLWRRRADITGSAEPTLTARARRLALTVTAVASVWILAEPLTLLAGRGDGRLHVTFLDVGQGDSALVQFPAGATMLVDAGGLGGSASFDIGDRVVAPVLRERGIRQLDYLVLTHGDPDHIGGAPAIVRDFGPREAWEGIPVPRFAPLTTLRLQTQASGARWANVYRDDRLLLNGVEIIARHPARADWERQKVRNDDSIVLEVRWRDVSLLFTGDIGTEIERTLAGDPVAPLRVLKVPHHGSLTSSSPEFLQAFRPQVAVFTAGRANHFGHPAPAVVQRYQANDAQIFRTDRDGAVTLDTDGYSIQVHTFNGRTFQLPRKHESTK